MRRLLVVEDSPADVELFREALSENRATVELDIARHGEEALEVLATPTRVPDLVVLDLNLPRMSGFELLGALRAHADRAVRRLPVVVFSTSRAQSDIDQAYDRGASSFMTKPTAFDEYVATVGAFRDFWLDVAQLPARA
jgi:chemotaxis family two-component system response regulator Rcp1